MYKNVKRIAGHPVKGRVMDTRKLTEDQAVLAFRSVDLHAELDRLLDRHDVQLRCERTKFGIKVTFVFRKTDVGLNVLTLKSPHTSISYRPDPSHLQGDLAPEPAPWSPKGHQYLEYQASFQDQAPAPEHTSQASVNPATHLVAV